MILTVQGVQLSCNCATLQVVTFIADVAAKEEALDKTSVTAAIWHVLRLLALNGGTLRSHSKSGKTKEGSPGERHSSHLATLTRCQVSYVHDLRTLGEMALCEFVMM